MFFLETNITLSNIYDHRFLLPRSPSSKLFPQVTSLAPAPPPPPPRQSNFQKSSSPASPLHTSTTVLVCIFPSILNHSQGNKKVQINRAFKSWSFFFHQKRKKKKKKSRQALHEIFFNLQFKNAEVTQSPISKSTSPFSVVPKNGKW